jgi:hypothetical protein
MSIAFESQTRFEPSSATSHTISHNNVSGDLLVASFVSVSNSGDVVTGVTYNGVALTKAVHRSHNSARTAYVWYLASPATGTHDLVISMSVSERAWGSVISLTGSDTSSPLDATAAVQPVASAAAISQDITTTADDTILISSLYINTAYASDGANTTNVSNYSVQIQSRSTTNIATAGAASLVTNVTPSSATHCYAIASFKSAAVAATNEVKSVAGISNA